MSSNPPWLSIVGIGLNGIDGLTPEQRRAIDQADVIAGGKRHLDMIGKDARKRLQWGAPFMDSLERVLDYKDRHVTVLATGDPMWFGVGATLRKMISAEEMRVLPAPSAFSLAAARMAWSIPDTECLSAHGRPVEFLIPFLTSNAQLLVLTANSDGPKEISALLIANGFGDSKLTVLGNLGAEDEIKIECTAANWNAKNIPSLNTVAIDCVAGLDAKIYPRIGGLLDDAFIHDGQLTKQEIRAVTLSALQPLPGQLLWDVGAGCGSISIEWMRSARNAQAYAIEKNLKRRAMIEKNGRSLGTPNIEIISGFIPDALHDLDTPDAIFIGGGLTINKTLPSCWDKLKSGGRIVANAVTLESEAILLKAQKDFGGELIKISIDRTSKIGNFNRWSPLAPVTQWRALKP
jgi:precorrin-6Y C5,15-methyltransferase (decarboxylating)